MVVVEVPLKPPVPMPGQPSRPPALPHPPPARQRVLEKGTHRGHIHLSNP